MDNDQKKDKPEVVSAKELSLIQELIRLRSESNRKLEYESFDGYEIPPRTQFSMLKKPAVTIKYGRFRCNMAALRLFEGIHYVLPMLNGSKKRLAIVPCTEEESASVEWSYQRQKDGSWSNKDVTSIDFMEKMFNLMNWNKECRYKALGHIADSDRGLILVFDLEEAIMFEPNKEEVIDPVTGEIKQRQIKYYPDYYQGRIGRSYNDYARVRQLSLFEDVGSYENTETITEEKFARESPPNTTQERLISEAENHEPNTEEEPDEGQPQFDT